MLFFVYFTCNDFYIGLAIIQGSLDILGCIVLFGKVYKSLSLHLVSPLSPLKEIRKNSKRRRVLERENINLRVRVG